MISPQPTFDVRVSVLMTARNAMPFLTMSIESILRQTFDDWEFIIVDNGSIDGSAEEISKYGDSRVRPVLLGRNIGRTAALRHGFNLARGTYIAVLDADDVAHPERLQKQVTFLDAHPEVVLLGSWVQYINESEATVGDWTPDVQQAALLEIFGHGNPIVHSSAMYRRSVAEEVGGYPAEVLYSQDYALWLNLLDRGNVAMLPERLCQLRILAHSITRSAEHRIEVAYDKLQAMLAARQRIAFSTEGRRRNRQEIAIARIRYAIALTRAGRLGSGLGAVLAAVCSDPVSFVNNRLTRGAWRGE